MSMSSFESSVDLSEYAYLYDGVFASPDGSRLAGLFTDGDGEWVYVGSFAEGMERFQVSLAPDAEYAPIAWANESELIYSHYDGLFGVLDVESGEREVFGEREGHFRPVGELDGVIIGLVDTVSGSPRFTLVGCVRETGEIEKISEIQSENIYFDWPIFMDDSSVYIEDYRVDAESLADHGIHRFEVWSEDGEVCVESEFRSIWDELSATPFGIVNGWLVVRRGGLSAERTFSEDDDERELVLYDWDADEAVSFSFEGDFGGIVSDELVFFTRSDEEKPSLGRDGLLVRITEDGVFEIVERLQVDAGYEWSWCLLDDGLYGYSYEIEQCVGYINGEQWPVVTVDGFSLQDEVTVIDEFELDIAEGYGAEVYALDGVDESELSERPTIIGAYPSGADVVIRDIFGVELLERGFLLVNALYDDGTYYGKTLALAELIEKLEEKSYCGSIGLYGFSAGGTQVLNFASSSYGDLVECVFAGCPNLILGKTGHDAYMLPIEYEEDAPLLFKDYSPMYGLEQIDIPTRIFLARWDTRVAWVERDKIRSRINEELINVTDHDRGHGAIRIEDVREMLAEMVGVYEEHLR